MVAGSSPARGAKIFKDLTGTPAGAAAKKAGLEGWRREASFRSARPDLIDLLDLDGWDIGSRELRRWTSFPRRKRRDGRPSAGWSEATKGAGVARF
jgi:hypothetical protein